jgi:hypothetical protein
MRAARSTPTRWWLDPAFLALSPDAQRALYCLWTSPETPTSGITTLVASSIAERLRITLKVAASRLVELEQAGFVAIDHEARVIWLHGFVEIQLGGLPETNEKWVKATTSALKGLPETALTRRYRRHYALPDRVSIPHRSPLDTLSKDALLPVPSSPLPGSKGGDDGDGGRSA